MFFSLLNDKQVLREIWYYLEPIDICQLLKVDKWTNRKLFIDLNKLVPQEFSLDLEEFNEEERKKIIAQVVLCFPKLSKVNFSGGILDVSLQTMFNLNSVCESLEELHVKIRSNNGTKKINNLKKLKYLNISSSIISSEGLKNISKIGSIISLDISNCHYLTGTDFKTLHSLTNLASLSLRGNRTIYSNTDLWMLTTLTSLDLSYCDIRIDLDCLTYLTSLTSLNLSCDSRLEDSAMSNVSSLINLTFLDISHCYLISNIGVSYLSSLTNLTDLNIGFCRRITDISFITSLTNMISLDLSRGIGSSKLTDQQWIQMRSLTNITSLNLYNCAMSYNTWCYLCECTNLTLLCLEESSNTDRNLWSHLSNLTTITSLCLAKSSITDREVGSHLSNLTRITSLDLSSCQITTINSLCDHLTNIVCLDLSNCCLHDDGISSISSMTKIEKLALCPSFPSTKVDKSALFSVSEMINLTDAALIHVSSLINLKTLSIPCNNIKPITNSNLNKLCNLEKLENLFIYQINRVNNDEIDLSNDIVNKFVSIKVFHHIVKALESKGRGVMSTTGFKHIEESRILKKHQHKLNIMNQ